MHVFFISNVCNFLFRNKSMKLYLTIKIYEMFIILLVFISFLLIIIKILNFCTYLDKWSIKWYIFLEKGNKRTILDFQTCY